MDTASAFLQCLVGSAAPLASVVAAEYQFDELARGLPEAANRELSERVHQLLQGFLQPSSGQQ
jgi:hypothetical protein